MGRRRSGVTLRRVGVAVYSFLSISTSETSHMLGWGLRAALSWKSVSPQPKMLIASYLYLLMHGFIDDAGFERGVELLWPM